MTNATNDLHYLSLADVSAKIRTRELSPVAITEYMLARIDRLNPTLHGYVTVMHESAMAAARTAEREIMAGQNRGPLHGVPIAVKDLCLTADAPTGFGTAAYKYGPADGEATAVTRLRQAGAVLLGKLTMTEGATLFHHPTVPTPLNPWSALHWPGASSSGSGAATAAGLCFAALGSDTAGSIRNPSSCNSLTGLVPTWGRVSRHGVLALAEVYDRLGPMARSAEDAAIVLGAMAGVDPEDPTTLRAAVPDYRGALASGVGSLRIGIDRAYVADRVEPSIVAAFDAAIATLCSLGARTVATTMPDWKSAVMAGATVIAAEVAAIHGKAFDQKPDAFTPDLANMIRAGRALPSPDLIRSQRVTTDFAGRLAAVFDDMDVLAMPILPIGVPTVARIAASGEDMAAVTDVFGRFTMPVNISGRPSLTLPCGFDGDGLPIGFQLVGRHLSEDRLLAVGHAFQQVTAWHLRHPPC